MIAAGTGFVAGGLIGSGAGTVQGLALAANLAPGTAATLGAMATQAGKAMLVGQATYTGMHTNGDYDSGDMMIAAGASGVAAAASAGLTSGAPLFKPAPSGAQVLQDNNIVTNILGNSAGNLAGSIVQATTSDIYHNRFNLAPLGPSVSASIVTSPLTGLAETGAQALFPPWMNGIVGSAARNYTYTAVSEEADRRTRHYLGVD